MKNGIFLQRGAIINENRHKCERRKQKSFLPDIEMPEQNRVINGSRLTPQLRKMRKKLESSGLLRENRLLERELQELIRTAAAGGQYFPAGDKTPLLGAAIASLEEITDETVRELIRSEQQRRYVCEEELNSLLWQSKYCLVKNALEDTGGAERYIGKMYALNELDEREWEKLSPLHAAFEADEIYRLSSPETKKGCRSKAAAVARCAGIDEERYTRELMKRAETEGEHLGSVIMTDFRRVFPYAGTTGYFLRLFGITALLSLGVGFFSQLWIAAVAFLPLLGVVKPVNDLLTARSVRGGDLPRMDIGDSLPENGRTACVLSALVSDEKNIEEALQRLRTAKLKNPAEGIYFALLCDMPAAGQEKLPEDNKLFGAAERLRSGIFPESVIIFRRRSYSKTMRKWQGFDRKRGAVEELVRFMCGKRVKFRTVLGDAEPLKSCEFIVALDFDTVPLMDSIKELAAIALHPLNKDYGIIAPRSTSTLDSTLKTGFSRLFAGNGGVSGISAYDSFCGEFYFDCFGEGIFCGKGLIRKQAFLRDCTDKFPAERVLSHDILEGGLTGVAYAGDVEFSDSFPASSRSFFKRAHRWLRGDFQNLRFLFKKGFSPLTRFKLFDNFRRGVSPLLTMALFFLSCFVSGGTAIGVTAYCCVLLPFLPPLISSLYRGFAFGITRRFYSPIISETAQLALHALAELMTLPKSALTSLDAGWKTLWRNLVSKRNLLEWTTFGLLEKSAFKGGSWHLLPSFAVSLLLLAGCVYGHKVSAPAALVMCAALPVLVFCDGCDRQEERDKPPLNKKAAQELLEQTEKMWRFYTSYVTKETNYLPPDNVQYYPVYRVCPRTSPTNIGMYLLSAVCVCELGLISEAELAQTVEKTVESVEKLAKWRGNLYNWYDVRTLKKVSEFVSSVDSGNFVCCLMAVRQRLSATEGCGGLVGRCDRIIENTRLSEFYCKKRKLFSIGVDGETGELSKHRYDMLMSEARLMSYFAIASGQAPKEHWRALSRTMSRSGRYAGAIAWTGTMFEFYMPELLLTSKEGSMTYEALKFAFHCQKRRHTPFGISESGYYAFDREWNYQYKAHGVQKTALKGGMNSECVVSPYSSYLTLSREPLESWNNLVRLEKEGAFDPEFGFYEAVDYTRRRVGDKAVVKSHMAHHVGMSIAGAANTLKNNICSRLFMSSDKMRRAEELLEERVMPGEKILKIRDYSYENRKPLSDREEIAKQSLSRSPVNALGAGELTLYTSANGRFCGSYKGLQTVRRSRDFMNRPAGAFYGYYSNRRTYPFVFHPALGAEPRTVFSAEESEYSLTARDFDMNMTVTADAAHCAEIRSFYVRNKTRSRRQLTLCAYSEPVLAKENDYRAHPMFMDLFLDISYDRENKLFLFYRKNRNGGIAAACAAGFMQDEDFTYCLSREECTDYRAFSFFEKAPFRECSDGSLPSPCLFVKADISVDAGESRRQTMFYCYADTVEAAKENALALRKNGAAKAEPNAPSPLALSTVHGRMGLEALPALLYGEAAQRRILDAQAKNTLDSRALWRYGISGDLPLLVCDYDAETLKSAALMKQGLEKGGIDADLVILCENGLQRTMAEGYGFALVKEEIGQEMLTLIYALAAKVIDEPEPAPRAAKLAEILPVLPVKRKEEENGFTDDGYVIGSKSQTWCNVLANPDFGTLVSQNSLGFTWALNSRENKLTPWSNDLVRDSTGEMLLLKKENCWYDLVRGSKAVFSPQSCAYDGIAGDVESSVALGVYSEGMGKEITLTLLNGSDKEQQVELAYRLEPILGGDSERTSPIARIEDGTLVMANPRNPYFKGAAAVYCSKKAKFLFSRDDFARGDFSQAKTEGEGLRCDMTAVIVPLKLPPRGKERIRFILGYCHEQEKAAEYVKSLDGKACGVSCENEISIACPDGNLNRLFNTWLPHQALSCRLWARTGFFQNGGAYGFRDQLQDCLAIMYLSPKIAEEHIYRCAGSQFKEGDVLHWWHELGGKRVGVRTRYSDDLLWLPYAACEYADGFGGDGFWEREIPYCAGAELPEDRQELFMETQEDILSESLYLHCKKAIEKGFSKGENGLIKIGCGDWNDGYNNVGAEGKGESVWLSMFYVMCGRRFAAAARENDDAAYAEKLEKRVAELCVAIEENGWDGEWYLRAFYDNGEKMGGRDSDACRIDLLPQAFAALCGLPDTARAVAASNAAWNELVDRKNGIIKLFSPPFAEGKSNQRPGYVMAYPEGVRENGGQYTHAAVCYCLSCFKLGQNKRAFQLLNMLDPAAKTSRFGREPYFMTADIYTNPSCYGRGGWSMYTGAAAWYWKCIFEGLFGARVRKGKLTLSPNLPPEFSGATMKVRLNNTEINLHFVFADGGKKAETAVPLDGKKYDIQVFY